jgi:hypothetical protein
MFHIKAYQEFLDEHKKYDGTGKCICSGCKESAYYEGGDKRCWCPMCEEHVGMKERYRSYLEKIHRSLRVRRIWNPDEPNIDQNICHVEKLLEETKE